MEDIEMPIPLILLGGAFLLLREGSGRLTPINPNDGSKDPPMPSKEQFDEDHPQFIWENVYQNGDSVLWNYSISTGLLYDDGTDTRGYNSYLVIGNPEHDKFAHDSRKESGGHIQISGEWARVDWGSQQDAIDLIDSMSEDEEPAEEEPADDGFGGLPTVPDFGFNYSPTFGGGF